MSDAGTIPSGPGTTGTLPARPAPPATATSSGRLRRLLVEWLPAIVVFIIIVALWEVSLLALNVQSFLVPRPSVIAGSLASEWGTLAKGLVYTGGEALGGLLIGVLLGTAAGMATARWGTARELLLPIAIGASTIPIIAFAPITKNWFGYDNPVSRMTIVALMVFFPVMVNTIRGLTNVDPAALELMRSYAASDGRVLRSLRVPNALPYWFTALKIATTLSVIGAVVGEFFGGPLYSLGIYITLETGHSRYPTAWAGIVVACALGIALYLAVVAAEWIVMPWRLAREASN